MSNLRRMRVLVPSLVVALLASAAAPSLAAPSRSKDAPFSVPERLLRDAVACGELTQRPTVLLVHGTGSNADESWTRSYGQSLPAEGFDVCTVTMPGRTTGDAQVSAEYVAYAIRRVASLARRDVAVIGHSQGTLNARWALTFWPSTRRLVTDYVSIAGDHHGASGADQVCATERCAPSVWQQRPRSQFLAALNRRFETPPGVATTSVYSQTDELVQPASADPAATAWLRGASNIMVQSLCPGRPVQHVQALTDAVVFAVVLDALRHPGPAATDRLPQDLCARTTAPAQSPDDVAYTNAIAYGLAVHASLTAAQVAAEPPLAPYAR